GCTTNAVARDKIRHTLRAVERIVLSDATPPGAHIGGDTPPPYPLQELAVPIGSIGRHRRGLPSFPFREASDHLLRGHRLLTHACRCRLHDQTTIHRQVLSVHQSHFHTLPHDLLKKLLEYL